MTLLSIQNVTKRYDKHTVVNNINFQLPENTCVALIGPNGAGKTTTLRMLAGLIKPTKGRISFDQVKEGIDIRSLIGYLPQYPVFHSWMTGREFLIYAGQLAFLSKKEARRRADQLLEKVGIAEAKNKAISNYSGGMKQRLGIAQAIIHKPKLLMLDEPVASLDPIGRREVLTLMEEMKKEMTILFSTHILTDADEISDELILLHQGKIVESGPMKELRRKYQTSMIELKVSSTPTRYIDKLNHLENIRQVSIKGEKIYVSVQDIRQARQEILTLAIEEDWPLLNFSVSRSTLEDMFMKGLNK